MRTALAAALALLLLALGFGMGRSVTSRPAPVPPRPPAAVPAPPAAPSPDAEGLAARLKESEDRVESLRREIADQDRRREALEARLLQKPAAPPPSAAKEAPAAPPAAAQPAGRFLDFSKEWVEAGKQAAKRQLLARALTGELYSSRAVQEEFVKSFEEASPEQATALWDLASGTYLKKRVNFDQNPLPEFKEALWALRQRQADPLKRRLLATLLQTFKDGRITPEDLKER